MFNKNFTDDWIRTADLCYRKGVLYNWATTTAHGLERHFKHFRLIFGLYLTFGMESKQKSKTFGCNSINKIWPNFRLLKTFATIPITNPKL